MPRSSVRHMGGAGGLCRDLRPKIWSRRRRRRVANVTIHQLAAHSMGVIRLGGFRSPIDGGSPLCVWNTTAIVFKLNKETLLQIEIRIILQSAGRYLNRTYSRLLKWSLRLSRVTRNGTGGQPAARSTEEVMIADDDATSWQSFNKTRHEREDQGSLYYCHGKWDGVNGNALQPSSLLGRQLGSAACVSGPSRRRCRRSVVAVVAHGEDNKKRQCYVRSGKTMWTFLQYRNVTQ